MLTCRKTYSDIPFAHRQHRHDGHCAFIHGHNWSFTLTFACERTDTNGFVVDFGKLKYIRTWIDDKLDHACLLMRDDPLKDALIAAAPQAWKVFEVDDCSCEGLAKLLFDTFNPMVREDTKGRAWLVAVDVEEDTRNAATYAPRG